MNFLEMSTEELVNLIKSEGYTPQTGYGQFVLRRALRPEISMNEFVKIWNTVSGIAPIFKKSIQKTVTHKLVETFSDEPKFIELVEENEYYIRWLWGDISGGTPKKFIKSLEKV